MGAVVTEISVGSEWVHRGSGGVYRVLAITNLEAHKPDYEPTVVYVRCDPLPEYPYMQCFSKSVTRFLDGMERVR